MEVDAIIFDLGGVLLNINYQLTIQAFQDLGIADFEERFSQAKQSNLFDDLETGRIEEDEFFEGIRKVAGKNMQNETIRDAWNAMLLDFPEQRLQLLEKVKQHYRSFLLSNTNYIHLKRFNEILLRQHNQENLVPFFKEVFFSHEIGHRKPNRQTFEFIINKHGLAPGKTLFIDDTERHVQGARETGLLAFYMNEDKVEDIFDERGKLLPGFLAKLN